MLVGEPDALWKLQEIIRCSLGPYNVEASGDKWMQVQLHATEIPRDRYELFRRQKKEARGHVYCPFDTFSDPFVEGNPWNERFPEESTVSAAPPSYVDK